MHPALAETMAVVAEDDSRRRASYFAAGHRVRMNNTTEVVTEPSIMPETLAEPVEASPVVVLLTDHEKMLRARSDEVRRADEAWDARITAVYDEYLAARSTPTLIRRLRAYSTESVAEGVRTSLKHVATLGRAALTMVNPVTMLSGLQTKFARTTEVSSSTDFLVEASNDPSRLLMTHRVRLGLGVAAAFGASLYLTSRGLPALPFGSSSNLATVNEIQGTVNMGGEVPHAPARVSVESFPVPSEAPVASPSSATVVEQPVGSMEITDAADSDTASEATRLAYKRLGLDMPHGFATEAITDITARLLDQAGLTGQESNLPVGLKIPLPEQAVLEQLWRDASEKVINR